MEAYSALARFYDELNRDVPYRRIAAFYKKLFTRAKIRPNLILDLACGTGNMTLELARMGYEVIGVDQSPEMLSVAAAKATPEGCAAPVYLCQRAQSLDLYGTVDAAVSCLDGMGYILRPQELLRAFTRLRLFLNPGGAFIFDVNSARRLRSLGKATYTRECDGAFCVYSGEFSEKTRIMTYTLDLFEESGGLYRRYTERHRERAYEVGELRELLSAAGFSGVEVFGDMRLEPPEEDEGRIFFMAST